MALLRLFDPTTQFQTKSGALNVAGKLRIYVESTDDLANIYGDDGSRLPQPLILDSNGRARGLFVDSGLSYRLEAYDRNDSLLFTIRRLEPNASGTIMGHTVFIKGTPDEIDVEDSVTEKNRTYTVSLSAKVTGKIAENQEAILKESEARKAALDDKVDKVEGKGLSTEDYTTADKTKLDGIAAGAEVNQNAFGNVKVGSTTVSADSKTDTLELASSSAITLTPDAANDKVTIGVSTMGAASSSAAGTAGIVPAPGAGKQTSFLRGDGTWVVPTNTDTLVKATAKTDNVNYKILATASASPTSGNATEAVYDTDISLNPSTNTISANISGNAATAGTADKAVADNSGNNIEETYAKKTETEEAISNSVDQTYSSISTKAQSGVAVNEAFKTRETSKSDDSYTYLGMDKTYKGTEELYWKLVSFKTIDNYWTLQFEVDVSNGRKSSSSYDTETYETKRLTISGSKPGTVNYANELRYAAQGINPYRGYKNNIYYEISSNNLVTVYIKAIDRPNETQICRLKDVINFKGISKITWHEAANDAGTQPTNPVQFKELFPAIASTTSNIGSDSVPVYVNKGKPVVCNSSNLKAGKDDDGNVIKNTYQKKLTFDTTPTAGSTNPVTSGGIKTAIAAVDAKGIVINEINGENVICFE